MVRLLCVVALVACGSPHHAGEHDAPVSTDAAADALADASPDAGTPGLVTITIYDWPYSPGPVAGMPVLFQDASGAVMATEITDAQRQASAVMAPGGSVTARGPQRTGIAADWIYMFLAVKPGDHLVVGTAPSSPTFFSTTIKLPAIANVYEYLITSQCGGGGAVPATAPTSNAMFSCSPVDLYVRAQDTSNQHATMAAFYKTGVAVSAGATVDLTGETYRPLRSVELSVTNLPSNVDNIFADAWLVGSFAFPDEVITAGLTNGQFDQHVMLPDISGVTLGTKLTLSHQPPSAQPQSEVVSQVTPYGTSYTFDAANLITWLDSDPGFDPTANRLYWSESSPTTADYTRAEIIVGPAQNDPRPRYYLEVAGPYAPASLSLPVLVGDFAPYNLQSTDNLPAQKFYVARVAGGWDAMRENVFNTYVVTPPGFSVGQTAVASAPEISVVPVKAPQRR